VNTGQISKWLRKTPQPASIVIDDGRKVDVGNKGGRWTEVARTIEAMNATKLTALDSKGDVIRAIVMDGESEDESDVAKVKGESDLQVFAKLVADAYEKGTQAPAKLLDSAMTFIERQGQRLVAQDREIERLRMINSKLSAELLQLKALPPEIEGGEDGGIVNALIQGALMGQQQAAQTEAPVTNGKGARK
jgi:hypothetical protein